MAANTDLTAICEEIRKNYSPCDVSDALLKLNIPGAGFLKDISPIPSRVQGTNRSVAPISTVLFVAKAEQSGPSLFGNSNNQRTDGAFNLFGSHTGTTGASSGGDGDLFGGATNMNPGFGDNLFGRREGTQAPRESNIPRQHWTDCPASGSIVIFQQPPGQSVALLGDIVATRLKLRGVKGAIIDGRARDVVSCGELCKDGAFQVWSKALSSVGTSMEAKPWAVDVPLTIGGLRVEPGDILCADEGEGVVCVIPKARLREVTELLPTLKEADDGVLRDVQNGVDFATAIKNHPKHYTNNQ